MRDPDLVLRAQHAASALERAWERWRVMHGFGADPLPPVSSYVGYSLEEPWGQPRVVFGVGAEEAEKLAAILDGHDCVGPVHAEITNRSEWRQQASGGLDVEPGWPVPGRPLPVPLQVPAQQVSELDGPRRDASGHSTPNRADRGRAAVNGPGSGSAYPERHDLAGLPPFPDDEDDFAPAPVAFTEMQDMTPGPSPDELSPDELSPDELAPDGLLSVGLPSAEQALDGIGPEELTSNGLAEGEPARRADGLHAASRARAARAASRPRSDAGTTGTSARTRAAAKSATAGKAGAPAKEGTGQADKPQRRKPSLSAPLQVPKRVRTRRPAAPGEPSGQAAESGTDQAEADGED